jgi:DtxR family transcriptional regulator, manganese transport regulator
MAEERSSPVGDAPSGDPSSTEQQAASFRQTRHAHSLELAEDYVELIAELIETEGEARTVEIAQRLGVSHPTVGKTLVRLQREGLITRRPYRAVFLTDAGRELAEHARRRHQLVEDFLKAIGVSEERARIDAEGIEHHVSDETLAAFERLLQQR